MFSQNISKVYPERHCYNNADSFVLGCSQVEFHFAILTPYNVMYAFIWKTLGCGGLDGFTLTQAEE